MFLDWWTPIENLPALLKGALVSLELTLTVFALSLFFGTIVGFLRYNKHHKAGYRIATVYVELIRNTPMLVQIFFLYFGLPQFKIYLPALFAGILGLTINNTAYIAEIVRSGIQSIPKGQWEAAKCIGLNPVDVLRDVVLPQSFKISLPALIGFHLGLIKDTSIASIIGYSELLREGKTIMNVTGYPFETYILVAVIYFIICYPLSKYVGWTERKAGL